MYVPLAANLQQLEIGVTRDVLLQATHIGTQQKVCQTTSGSGNRIITRSEEHRRNQKHIEVLKTV